MSDVFESMRQMPSSGLIPVALLVVIGLMLWTAGRKILRPGFAVIGLVIGGFVGLMIGVSAEFGISPWIFAGVGATLLACMGAIAYRLAVTASMALLLGIVAPLSVVTIYQLQGTTNTRSRSLDEAFSASAKAVDDLSSWLHEDKDSGEKSKTGDAFKSAADSVTHSFDRATDALSDKLGSDTGRKQIEWMKQFTHELAAAGQQQWNTLPEELRPTLVFAAIAGVVVGLLLGSAAPGMSAAVVTALGGSILWLGGLTIVVAKLGAPNGPWLPSSGTGWLCVWLITAFLGLMLQWIFRRKTADKPA